MINENMLYYLGEAFASLKTQLVLKKKYKEQSVLLSILYVSSNDAFNLLSESGVRPSSMPRETFEALVSTGLIRMAEKPDNYVVTLKGVWEIESRRERLTYDILFERLDKKYFDLFKQGGQISEKEKVILLSMIAVRAFSVESALDLKKGDTVLASLQGLVQSSFDLLSQNHLVQKLKQKDLFGARGNEEPVSNLIRHTDALPKKTRGIFKALGKQKYYLDLYAEDGISEEGLNMILGLIFGLSPREDLKETVNEFFLRNAYEHSKYLFDFNVHRFANPVFDLQLREALENFFATPYKWNLS